MNSKPLEWLAHVCQRATASDLATLASETLHCETEFSCDALVSERTHSCADCPRRALGLCRLGRTMDANVPLEVEFSA